MPTTRTAGYSGTPLVQKLGLKRGMAVRVVDAPPHYRTLLGTLPDGVRFTTTSRNRTTLDFIHLFALTTSQLRKVLPGLKRSLKPDGLLWISWPKMTSSLKTDLRESIVREAGLAAGLVDVKVCAVEEDWSGLKFVYRVKDRAAKRA